MSKIDVALTKNEDKYHLVIEAKNPKSAEEIWHYVATTKGYQQWFEELKVEYHNMRLLFEMDDFHEEMRIVTWIEKQAIQYEWDQAVVEFNVSDNLLIFTEVMPQNFPNPVNDLAGWCVQIERLNQLLNDEVVVSRSKNKVDWEAFINEQRINL